MKECPCLECDLGIGTICLDDVILSSSRSMHGFQRFHSLNRNTLGESHGNRSEVPVPSQQQPNHNKP
jgi:hypothetical protein